MPWVPAPRAEAATWRPELKLESRYDDNVLHRPQGFDDFVGVVTPGLTVSSRDPITSFELAARSGFTSYTRTAVKSSRHDEAWLELSHRPDSGAGLDLDASYIQSLDPIDFSQGAVTSRNDVTSASGNATADFHHAGGTLHLRRWDYRAGDLADGNSLDATGRLYPINTRVTTVSFAARHRQLEVGDRLELEADYQTAAFKRQHRDNFWTEAEAGRVEIRFHDGSPNEVRPALAFRFARTAGAERTPTTLRFEIADDIATQLDAGISHDGGGRFGEVAWQTTVDADGGIYRVATLSRRVSLAARDTLASGQVIDAGGSFGRIRPVRDAGPRVDQWRAAIGFSTPVGPYLSGRAGWDFLRQDAPVGGATADFDRN